jgi:hypothetical protein
MRYHEKQAMTVLRYLAPAMKAFARGGTTAGMESLRGLVGGSGKAGFMQAVGKNMQRSNIVRAGLHAPSTVATAPVAQSVGHGPSIGNATTLAGLVGLSRPAMSRRGFIGNAALTGLGPVVDSTKMRAVKGIADATARYNTPLQNAASGTAAGNTAIAAGMQVGDNRRQFLKRLAFLTLGSPLSRDVSLGGAQAGARTIAGAVDMAGSTLGGVGRLLG